MNEYAEIHQPRVKEEPAASKPNASTCINSGSLSPHQPNKCGNGAAATAGGAKLTASSKPAYNDSEFPTIASANATSNDRKKQQQLQQQRSPRRGRAVSTLAVTPDKAAASPPSRGSCKQQAQRQPRQSPTSAASSPSNPQHKVTSAIKAPGLTAGPSSPSSQVQRRTARSHSDPPALTELTTCSNTAAVIAKASAFSPAERTGVPRQQQRSAVLF
jgi:hypothetical protein